MHIKFEFELQSTSSRKYCAADGHYGSKICKCTLARNFSKCWPMFTVSSPWDLSGKVVMNSLSKKPSHL